MTVPDAELRTYRLDERLAVARARRAAAWRLVLVMLLAFGGSAAWAAFDADTPEDFQRWLTGTVPRIFGALTLVAFVVGQKMAGAVREKAKTFLLIVGQHVVRVSATGTPTIELRRSELADITFTSKKIVLRAKDGRAIRLFEDVIGWNELRTVLDGWKKAPIDTAAEALEAELAARRDPLSARPMLARELDARFGWRAVLGPFGREMLIGWTVLLVLCLLAFTLLGKGK